MSDKFDHTMDKAAGKAKEAAGSATGDDDLKEKGRDEQTKADVKDAVGDAKHRLGDAVDSVKDRLKKD